MSKKRRAPVEWCSICKYAKSHPQFDCLSQSKLTGFTADDSCHNFKYEERVNDSRKLPELTEHIPKPSKERDVNYPKTTITIPKKKVTFEFEVGGDWEPQTEGCGWGCPIPVNAVCSNSEVYRRYCPFVKNLTVVTGTTKETKKVKTGKWLDIGHDGTTHTYACSCCGHIECDNMTKHDAYCCSCGAHMIEEA